MIPLQLELTGFLSYRDPVSFDFRLSDICLLAGHNGSGKSSVFDGLSFSLFGTHRAGKVGYDNLIHHQCNQAKVRFVFEFAGREFCIERTITRKLNSTSASTRQASRWDGKEWIAIRETENDSGFKAWVNELGLTSELFNQSVLLRQGQAERLLDSTPTERHKTLAKLLNLERLDLLSKSAEGRSKTIVEKVKSLESERSALPLHSADDHLAMAAQIAATEEQFTAASMEVEAWQARLEPAIRFEAIQKEIAKLRGEAEEFERLESQADLILRRYQRFVELRTNLPTLTVIHNAHLSFANALATLARLRPELLSLDLKLAKFDTHAATIRHDMDNREVEIDALGASQCTLPGEIEQAKRDIERAQAIVDRSATIVTQERELAVVVNHLAHINGEHESLVAAAEAAERAKDESREQTQTAKRLQAELLAEKARYEKRRDGWTKMDGATTCDLCGQALTETHRAAELAQIAANLAQLAQQAADADAVCLSALQHFARAENAAVLCSQAVRTSELARTESATKQQFLHDSLTRERDRLAREWADFRAQIPTAPLEPESIWLGEFRSDRTAYREQVELQRNSIEQSLAMLRTQQRADEQSRQAIQKQRELTQRQHTQAESGIAASESQLVTLEEDIDAQAESLESAWRVFAQSDQRPAFEAMRDEQKRLVAEQIESQYQRVSQAAGRLSAMQERMQVAQAEADTYPMEHRQSVESVNQSRTLAESNRDSARKAHQVALHEQADAVRIQARRDELREQILASNIVQSRWLRLANLLGKQGLQRRLMQDAEEQIVRLANSTLGSLTNQAMELRLPTTRPEETSALDLSAFTDNNPEGRDIAFLSGSERFRVAISLAVAIGEFTGLHQQGAASIIIDEGFGCLDADNRYLMRSEFARLRERLQRIVVVTHQEDFAESIPDGYRLAMVNGTTQVTGFGRYG